jgi:hypothetical protein
VKSAVTRSSIESTNISRICSAWIDSFKRSI